jgi:deoxyribose-phosphate aldolase
MTELIGLVDLTSLNDDDTPEVVRDLCARAVTPQGTVAAVCVLAPFVEVAVSALDGTPVRVATVANFPAGDDDPQGAAAATRAAVAAGADEVDVVAPWRAQLAGDADALFRLVEACADAAGERVLKVILETGSHPGLAETRAMAQAALGAGADFLKTSTGKVGRGATPEAVQQLLETVRDHGSGGVKVSGGVRTAKQAQAHVAMAQAVLGPDWVTPATFRLGASSLLDDLLGEA